LPQEIDQQLRHIRTNLALMGNEIGKPAPAEEICLIEMRGVISGFFDEKTYRETAEAYCAQLEKELADL
jgi:hypothetical protein